MNIWSCPWPSPVGLRRCKAKKKTTELCGAAAVKVKLQHERSATLQTVLCAAEAMSKKREEKSALEQSSSAVWPWNIVCAFAVSIVYCSSRCGKGLCRHLTFDVDHGCSSVQMRFWLTQKSFSLETTCNSQSHHNSFSRVAAARVCASKTIFFCRAECQVCDFGRDRTCVWFRRTHKKLQLDTSRPCVVSPKSSNLSTILQIRFCSLAALDLRSEPICAQNENEKEKKCSESNDRRARDCN